METIVIQEGRERARVHGEGGMEFECHVPGIGWIIDPREPSERLKLIALAVRKEAFPDLPVLTLADLYDD